MNDAANLFNNNKIDLTVDEIQGLEVVSMSFTIRFVNVIVKRENGNPIGFL